jgi:kumamolisin
MASKKKSSRPPRTPQSSAVRKRVPANKKPGVSRTHVIVNGSERAAPKFATRVRDANARDRVEVTLDLKAPDLPGADALPRDSLTPQELEMRYGASADDIAKVTSMLRRYGLEVTHSSRLTRSMKVVGTAKQIETAFQTRLGIYKDASGRDFRDREGTYAVPKDLESLVTAVIGLGQRRVARRRSSTVTQPVSTVAPLGPADLEQLYVFPPGAAAGEVIGIAEFGGGYFANDLQAYCRKFRRPVPTINAIAVNAPAYTLQQILALPNAQRKDELDSSIEVMMDIELIAGLCSGAKLNVYFASFDQQGWVNLLNRAIEDRPTALSVSWGLAEDDSDWSPAARAAINRRLNTAALLGINVCAAAGDDGSGDEETDGRFHVDFPAASPFVLAVGGTQINGGLSPANEVVWWKSPGRRTPQGGGATGGGVSVLMRRPAWQAVKIRSLNSGNFDGRVVPDIAALAGHPLFDLITFGHDAPNGGTSASAPLWASLLARLDANLPAAKRRRGASRLLYLPLDRSTVGASSCNDITSGNNASMPQPGRGYRAGVGFDAVSGWGTPRGTDLLTALPRV